MDLELRYVGGAETLATIIVSKLLLSEPQEPHIHSFVPGCNITVSGSCQSSSQMRSKVLTYGTYDSAVLRMTNNLVPNIRAIQQLNARGRKPDIFPYSNTTLYLVEVHKKYNSSSRG